MKHKICITLLENITQMPSSRLCPVGSVYSIFLVISVFQTSTKALGYNYRNSNKVI